MLPARIPAQSADPRGLPGRPGGVSAVADAPQRRPAAEHRGGARPEILEATPEADTGHWRVDGARFGRSAPFQPYAHGVFRARVQVVDAEWVMDVPPDAGRSADPGFEGGRRAGTGVMLGMRAQRIPVPAESTSSVPAAGDAQAESLARLALSLYQAVADGPAGRRSVDLFV
jgi:hypothetical protein